MITFSTIMEEEYKMDTRKISTEYRMRQWMQLLQEKAETGESVSVFCNRIGVNKNTYFYWQKKLREATAKMLESPQANPPQEWALAVQTSQPELSEITIEVNDCRITVTPNTDEEFLVKICRTLKKL
jgi:putative transposase